MVNELSKFSKEQLIEIILKLDRKISELEKTSQTSSNPPSSDRYKKNQSLREKSNKPSGGQKGHKGKTLTKSKSPDQTIQYQPEICIKCGESLLEIPNQIAKTIEEIDLPEKLITRTEHQQLKCKCPKCGTINKGKLPSNLKSHTQYGPKLKSLIISLSNLANTSYKNISNLTKSIFNLNISEGTIDNTIEKVSQTSSEYLPSILETIKSTEYCGGDESSIRNNGEKHWEWIWQNELASYYVTNPSRSYKVIQETFGEDYQGTYLSDCYGAQLKSKSYNKQICHFHLLRDLNYCIQYEKDLLSYQMKIFLIKSWKARKHIWSKNLHDKYSKVIRENLIQQFNNLLYKQEAQGITSRRIQKRLQKHSDKVLTFINSPTLPYHNNSSEQTIRKIKVKQKVSGCFRSTNGINRYNAISSVMETCRKQGINLWESINSLVKKEQVQFKYLVKPTE